MSKLTLEFKMEITGVKIVPVITPDYGFDKGNPVDGAPLSLVISIKMFNEMIELYNEKHKDDDKITLTPEQSESFEKLIDEKVNGSSGKKSPFQKKMEEMMAKQKENQK